MSPVQYNLEVRFGGLRNRCCINFSALELDKHTKLRWHIHFAPSAKAGLLFFLRWLFRRFGLLGSLALFHRLRSTAVLKRCQILLELDEEQGTGLTYAQLAHSYAVCPATITNIIQSYVRNGIKDIIRYNISPNSSAALRKVDGCAEAHIIQMACSPAPEGHSRWTLRLLEGKARIELDVPAGRETIRQTLKNELRPHKNAYWRIPPKESAGFAARMEDILDIYEKPYQLLGEARKPFPMRPGTPYRGQLGGGDPVSGGCQLSRS